MTWPLTSRPVCSWQPHQVNLFAANKLNVNVNQRFSSGQRIRTRRPTWNRICNALNNWSTPVASSIEPKNISTNGSSRSSGGGLTVPIDHLKDSRKVHQREITGLLRRRCNPHIWGTKLKRKEGKNGLQVRSRVESLVGTFIISPVGTRWSRQSTTCSFSWKSSFIGRGIPRFYSNFPCPFNSATFFGRQERKLSLFSQSHAHTWSAPHCQQTFSAARRQRALFETFSQMKLSASSIVTRSSEILENCLEFYEKYTTVSESITESVHFF